MTSFFIAAFEGSAACAYLDIDQTRPTFRLPSFVTCILQDMTSETPISSKIFI